MPEKKAYSGIPGLAGAAIRLNEDISLIGGKHKETDKGVFGRGKVMRPKKAKKTKKSRRK